MSELSNNQGRAFEYIFLKTLHLQISSKCPANIIDNSSLVASKRAWDLIDEETKENLLSSSKAAIDKIFELEPLILEGDCVELFIQPDNKGKAGDVRDIIVQRNEISWQIGFSLKHNHFAVKHSRLSKVLDFGKEWYCLPCSDRYWQDINPIFSYLDIQKDLKRNWSDLGNDKITKVYLPLLTTFIKEVKNAVEIDTKIPSKLVEYLLGCYDFYKVISIDKKKTAQLQSFNLHSQLNKPSKSKNPLVIIPISKLPTRIVSLDFKPNSTNTVEMYMDNGWQFSFRIHNASTKVETSLKFDIQIIGMPATIITFNCLW